MSRHESALRRMFIPKELIGDSTSDVLRENFYVMGKYLDETEDSGTLLIDDLFPDVTEFFLEDYERIYKLDSEGTDADRRSKIIAAHRARGGLSKEYFEALGDTFGGGNYTVVLTEGTGTPGFIVHEFSSTTVPPGPATLLPGQISDSYASSFWEITVTVTGSSGPETNLENLFNRLKPAHCRYIYVYVP